MAGPHTGRSHGARHWSVRPGSRDLVEIRGAASECQLLWRSLPAAGQGVSGTGVRGLPSRNQLVRLSTTS